MKTERAQRAMRLVAYIMLYLDTPPGVRRTNSKYGWLDPLPHPWLDDMEIHMDTAKLPNENSSFLVIRTRYKERTLHVNRPNARGTYHCVIDRLEDGGILIRNFKGTPLFDHVKTPPPGGPPVVLLERSGKRHKMEV